MSKTNISPKTASDKQPAADFTIIDSLSALRDALAEGLEAQTRLVSLSRYVVRGEGMRDFAEQDILLAMTAIGLCIDNIKQTAALFGGAL